MTDVGPPHGVVPEAARFVALIRDRSAVEAREIAAHGEERARRVLADAMAEAETILAAARREGEERGRRRAAELVAAAEAAAHMTVLRAREALIEDVFARVRARLAAYSSTPDAGAVVARLVAQAIGALPDGALRVRLGGEEAGLLDAATRARLANGRTLRFECDAVPGGGVIVETEDGRVAFDNSFTARLRRIGDGARAAVAAALLAEQGAAG
jgi:vacuolar-type H+-ATPase subunit E/Vma4